MTSKDVLSLLEQLDVEGTDEVAPKIGCETEAEVFGFLDQLAKTEIPAAPNSTPNPDPAPLKDKPTWSLSGLLNSAAPQLKSTLHNVINTIAPPISDLQILNIKVWSDVENVNCESVVYSIFEKVTTEMSIRLSVSKAEGSPGRGTPVEGIDEALRLSRSVVAPHEAALSISIVSTVMDSELFFLVYLKENYGPEIFTKSQAFPTTWTKEEGCEVWFEEAIALATGVVAERFVKRLESK